MSVLTLKELQCIKKQEVTTDQIRVKVDGNKVAGDFNMGKDDSITLNTQVNFTGTATIKVIEVDSNSKNEVLGSHVVRDSQAGTGQHDFHFNDSPHWDYRLTYEIS